ncbi:Mbov_0400 family ICE element protein [[Mycoplasma] collis]|uniref:Mbov_0400 family ICE element protein n=1 Tax=[Mycoplasma] collis TaxID=2127 RepID=UPI00051C42C1|nr:hypothetical protein [[Mycoplasma] collis]
MPLEKMKPFFTKQKYTTVFNRYEEPIEHHPLVILYDVRFQRYYYLKIRSAYNAGGKLRNKYDGEIFINKAAKGLLSRDSYVDTTQIFSIPEKELEKIVNTNDVLYLDTENFTRNQIDEIYENLMHNLGQIPPYVSLVRTKFNPVKNDFEAKTLYSHPEFMETEFNRTKRIDKLNFKKWILNIQNQEEEVFIELKNIRLSAKTELLYSEKDQYYENKRLEQQQKDEDEMEM